MSLLSACIAFVPSRGHNEFACLLPRRKKVSLVAADIFGEPSVSYDELGKMCREISVSQFFAFSSANSSTLTRS